MGQLSMFTVEEETALRDRTRSRAYSAEREEFRRAHARRREWGKAVRHAAAIYRQFHEGPDSGPPLTPEEILLREARRGRRPGTTSEAA